MSEGHLMDFHDPEDLVGLPIAGKHRLWGGQGSTPHLGGGAGTQRLDQDHPR